MLIAVVACSSSERAPARDERDDCAAVAGRMDEIVRSEPAADPGDPLIKALPQLIAAVVASCREDAWPADVKTCFISARRDGHLVDHCIERMPAPVKDKLMARIGAIVDDTMRSGGPAAPAPTLPPAAAPPTTP